MTVYKYEVLVELPDDDVAVGLIANIHGAVCGGGMVENDEGEQEHKCAREWQASVHGFRPVFASEPEPVAAIEAEAENFNGN